MNAVADYRSIASAGVLLAFAAFAGTGLLSLAADHSAPYIAANKEQALLEKLNAVIPADRFNNDLTNDTVLIEETGDTTATTPTRVFRARADGAPVAVAYEWTAHGGYNGDIVLLMGVSVDGKVTGVRIVDHRETPGLGDAIEARRSDWIDAFRGRSLLDPGESGWRVRKDGGEFDQFAGATITPRAVVNAVHDGLKFFSRHRDELFVVGADPGPSKI